MKKIYLCHPSSTTGEFNDSIRIAEEMEKLGFEVYAPARNKAINDKSNNPTPQMIYEQDVERLLEADIIVMNLTGGDSDGTIRSEEHTSELQSRFDLVCRLLLEKK